MKMEDQERVQLREKVMVLEREYSKLLSDFERALDELQLLRPAVLDNVVSVEQEAS